MLGKFFLEKVTLEFGSPMVGNMDMPSIPSSPTILTAFLYINDVSKTYALLPSPAVSDFETTIFLIPLGNCCPEAGSNLT